MKKKKKKDKRFLVFRLLTTERVVRKRKINSEGEAAEEEVSYYMAFLKSCPLK